MSDDRRITRRQLEQWLAALRQGQSTAWCRAYIVDPRNPPSLKDRIEMRIENIPVLRSIWAAVVPM